MTLVIDVQHAEHPDLRSFDRAIHKAVLLDEVSSPAFLVGNKKLLQAHVDGAILGQSPTQLFTYEAWLWRTPIMLTTNNWVYGELPAADRNWIETNCVAVYIGEPVWQTPATQSAAPSQVAPPPSPALSGRSDVSGRVWTSVSARSAAPGEVPPLPGAARRRHAVKGPEASPEHKRARDAA